MIRPASVRRLRVWAALGSVLLAAAAVSAEQQILAVGWTGYAPRLGALRGAAGLRVEERPAAGWSISFDQPLRRWPALWLGVCARHYAASVRGPGYDLRTVALRPRIGAFLDVFQHIFYGAVEAGAQRLSQSGGANGDAYSWTAALSLGYQWEFARRRTLGLRWFAEAGTELAGRPRIDATRFDLGDGLRGRFGLGVQLD